ncbi:MAG: cellulose synthase operon protein YhjQ/BcsQ [Pirellulaceae bacterium]|nr:hypothetical protein [Planctomycetales bacterium]MCA9204479.1 hypothetical protein [Planctomycetales bacterium]
MSDQATELRKLVLRAARERVAAAAPPPKMIALFGGRPEVGVTTLAIELALAVARQGLRAVLVDADLRRAEIARRCKLRENNGIAEVLAARRDVHEVLERGPCGLQILPGPSSPIHHEVTPREQQRLLQQIHTLGLHADWVLVDAGEIANPLLTTFWKVADQPVLVTTSESSVLMDSYASLKTLHAQTRVAWPRLIVNRVDDATTADEVATRIGRSCERFLEAQLGFVGFVPENIDSNSAGEREPWQPGDTETPAARAVSRLAVELTQAGSKHNRAGPHVA